MKRTMANLNPQAAPLALILALLGVVPATAQTWQTVLDFQLAPGKSADGPNITADALGNVFAGGNGSDAIGTNHGLVLKTDNTQATWALSDDTNPDATKYESYLWNLGFDGNGNLYSVGQLEPDCPTCPMPQPYWYVRKSSDSGATWSTVDLYQYATGQYIDASGFAADSAGNIYIAGWGRDAGTKRNPQGNLHWLVRRSTDGGNTWAVVDDVLGTSGAHGAGFVPGAGVFVVGVPYANSSSMWLVRRSATGAMGTWSTVDGPITGGAAQAVCSDSQGNIYVAGTQFITTATKPEVTGYYAWVTRKSSDGGNTWATVDSFNYAQNQSAAAAGLGRTPTGSVAVVGYGSDAQGARHWIVRTPAASGAWQTIDDYVLSPGLSAATATGITTDSAGNLLVSGNARDANGYHTIVRRF